MNRLHRWFPFLSWPRPSARLLRGEALAGLTVALIMVPQTVAYAALAGMPLVTGFYAALLPTLVGVLWSSSTRLAVGPTALTCLLVGASITGMAEPGSPQWVAIAVWLAILSGALQLALGLAKSGWLLNLISSPVLAGFTQAAALLIIASQLPALLGLEGSLSSLWSHPKINTYAAAMGLGGLVMLMLGKRYWPHIPMIMLVVVGAAVISYVTRFEALGGAVVGNLPSALPTLQMPLLLPMDTLSALVLPAMMIALVSFVETASSAKIESQKDGIRWNDNQDLIGQGLAKLASAAVGSFPTSASFSRAAITLYSGARTGWATVFLVSIVLLALLFFTPALHHVPRSILAAVVVAAVMGLIKTATFHQLWRVSRVEAITSGMTFAITLLTAPRIYWGVLAGVLMGLGHFLHYRLHPRIIEVGLHPDGSLRDRHLWKLPPLALKLYALRMDAELDFAAASNFERHILEHLATQPEITDVCLFANAINRVDVTGVETFRQLLNTFAQRGITLHISGLKLPVEQILRQAGLLAPDARLKMYRTDAETLEALRNPPAA
ncbi:MAG: hypothetical protein RIS34_336 [Pseudomonadota bacterium]|jgi:sulfate permease, SulP family